MASVEPLRFAGVDPTLDVGTAPNTSRANLRDRLRKSHLTSELIGTLARDAEHLRDLVEADEIKLAHRD